ncbi:MAG: AmmeMemoRadiSam system radical SAM enzyme [Bacillota bacterium]|nr:AmmeMemoRadiSam system radical SAM enzyme [Bacillota bacterium]MDW7676985.1 AmmeMemoRadiSam system radical SAM enzyme [Bacillota bacterium]
MLAQFATQEGKSIRCGLCPHQCLLDPGKTGICRVRRYDEEGLVSLNYGKISAIQLDPVEKKPLARFMPGTRTYSIGSYGCNLRCPYCQNYHIAMEYPKTRTLSPEQVIEQALASGVPSISYTYNEPIVFYEFVHHTAALAKKSGLSNILVTNGYICQEPLKKLLPLMDAMNIDLKAFSDETYRKICGGKLQPVLETIRTAHERCHVEITTLLVTNMHTLQELNDMINWIAALSTEIPLHISRYFPGYHYNEPPTPVGFINDIYQMAAQSLKYVYKGNI